MVPLRERTDENILELGCGERRHRDVNVAIDIKQVVGVDFVCDLAKPDWPEIGDAGFDVVYAGYVIEHISYTLTSDFLKNIYRILRPGGRVVLLLPNTETQFDWIKSHPQGWDGKLLFPAASELLYGTQPQYPNDPGPDTHKAYFDPRMIRELLLVAGFENVVGSAFGERGTDMHVVARKAQTTEVSPDMEEIIAQTKEREDAESRIREKHPGAVIEWSHGTHGVPVIKSTIQTPMPLESSKIVSPAIQPQSVITPVVTIPDRAGANLAGEKLITKRPESYEGEVVLPSHKIDVLTKLPDNSSAYRAGLFDKEYFNGGKKVGGYAREGYWDYPVHEISTQHVLARKPESVLEVGCARGYILKRLQDAGIEAQGLEISKHCWLTRACNGITVWDLCKTPWPYGDKQFDLVFSIATLEHIPEEYLSAVIKEMRRVGKRHLHGIDFGHKDDFFDKTHCTLKPQAWWRKMFDVPEPPFMDGKVYPAILDKEDLERGQFPQEVLIGDGKLKLNLGCFTTMHHHGWLNMDVLDMMPFAQVHGYKFQRCDLVHGGIPFGTGVVDLIMMNHVLEHFTYEQGLKVLRDCRRVIRKDGCIRVVVPSASKLINMYDVNGRSGVSRLSELDEINEPSSACPTPAGKLWSLLFNGHQSMYDAKTLCHAFDQAGFLHRVCGFRQGRQQILRETLDMVPELSLIVEGIPG